MEARRRRVRFNSTVDFIPLNDEAQFPKVDIGTPSKSKGDKIKSTPLGSQFANSRFAQQVGNAFAAIPAKIRKWGKGKTDKTDKADKDKKDAGVENDASGLNVTTQQEGDTSSKTALIQASRKV